MVVARGSNCYGPRQNREKLIPTALMRALNGRPVPLYGDGLHIRDWMFVEDFCRGILAALDRGEGGETYNFGGGTERTNLQVVRSLLVALGKDEADIEFVSDRLGHDRRYAMDFSKATEELGWEPRADFRDELIRTTEWYRNHLSVQEED